MDVDSSTYRANEIEFLAMGEIAKSSSGVSGGLNEFFRASGAQYSTITFECKIVVRW